MNKPYTLTLLFIAVVIGLLNWYSTPTMMEDLLYRFVWQQHFDSPLERVSSLADVLRSQEIHYWSNSGRVLVHGMVQVLLNLVPEWLAKLLNTAMFVLLIVLVTKFTGVEKELRAVVAALTFTMIFVVMQGFCMGFIWIVGATNYLWPMVVNMVFILMLTPPAPLGARSSSPPLGAQSSSPAILALIAGWSHEALALPVFVALLYWYWRRNGWAWLTKRREGLCILAYFLGLLMILLSPALWHRTGIADVTLGDRLLAGAINLVKNIRISWLLVITLAIRLHRGRRDLQLDNLRYILTAWAVALGIVLACGETLERVAIYADFLAMLALLKIWQGEWLKVHKTATAWVTMTVCAIVAIPAVALNRENHENYLYHCRQIESGAHIIKIRQTTDGSNMADQWLREHYVYPNVEFGFPNCYMPFDSQDLETRCVAKLFDKEDIIMLPEDVVDKIERDTAAYTHWEADSNEKLFIWRLKPGQQVSSVVFELGDEVPLPFYKRWTSYPDDKFELDNFKYEVITLKGNRYLVMTIPMNKIKRRIRNIRPI